MCEHCNNSVKLIKTYLELKAELKLIKECFDCLEKNFQLLKKENEELGLVCKELTEEKEKIVDAYNKLDMENKDIKTDHTHLECIALEKTIINMCKEWYLKER